MSSSGRGEFLDMLRAYAAREGYAGRLLPGMEESDLVEVDDQDVRFAVFDRGGSYFVGPDVPGRYGPGVRRVTPVGSRHLGEGLAAAWNSDRVGAREVWRRSRS